LIYFDSALCLEFVSALGIGYKRSTTCIQLIYTTTTAITNTITTTIAKPEFITRQDLPISLHLPIG